MSSKKPSVVRPSVTAPGEVEPDAPRRPRPKVKLKISKPAPVVDKPVEPAIEPTEPPPSDPPPIKTPRLREEVNRSFDEDAAAEHGKPYIRLLNATGCVRPVLVEYVADRLCDGYHFIVDEPAVPRHGGDPERLDGDGTPGFFMRAVLARRPSNRDEALQYWLSRMQEDAIRFDGRSDLLWSYIATVRRFLDGIVSVRTAGADLLGQ